MGLNLHRRAGLPASEIADLEKAMAAYYRNPPTSYYEIADTAAEHYTPQEQPFHCDLAGRVTPGVTMLELGCGTAHLCPHVIARGGRYTGMDHSEALLETNRRRHPAAQFVQVGEKLGEAFDIVASLYTIEHIVDPPAYLEIMWQACRPGGLLAIICPEFVECRGLPPSVFYGRTARRFREKLRAFDLFDAAQHLLDLKWRGPRWKRLAQQNPPGAFWINLAPAELSGAVHAIDTDAVHLPRLSDLAWWFEQRGANILVRSDRMPDIAPEVAQFNCYVLAQRPKG